MPILEVSTDTMLQAIKHLEKASGELSEIYSLPANGMTLADAYYMVYNAMKMGHRIEDEIKELRRKLDR